MAKLTRQTQKLFAQNVNKGTFGSFKLGTPTVATTLADMQSAEYLNGWIDGYKEQNGNKQIPIEEQNTLQYINNYQQAYLLQEGIAEYDIGTEYYIDSLVKNSGLIYKSLIDSNIGQSLSDASKWQVLGDLKTSINVVYIDKKEDLPSAISNVITLEAKTYIFTSSVDLLGDRLVAIEGTAILGLATDSCKISSTGLTGSPLITSNYTLSIRHITLEAETPFNLDASANADQILSWFEVHLENCTNSGVIKSYSSFIGDSINVLNSAGISFDGSINTIGFIKSYFDIPLGKVGVNFESSLILSLRSGLSYTAFNIASTGTAIKINAGATIPNEGFLLDNCNFSGSGVYLDGISSSDIESRFRDNRGIANSISAGQYYMNGNTTPTTIASSGTYTKILGSTSAGSIVQRFDVSTSNKAIYTGSLTDNFIVHVVLTFTGTNNDDLSFKIAKNGVEIDSSQLSRTVVGTGNYASVALQDIVELSTNDYIEVFATNDTNTNNIIIKDLNVIVSK
jgi:hypothetical protein